MSWLPNAVVTVNGVDFTDKSLWNVQINYGRNTVWEQARAGYASVQILNLNNANFNFQINQNLIVTVEDSTGNPVTVFSGLVNDISNTLSNVGILGNVGVQTLTALAPFAFMARKIVGELAYPKEYDDDRISRIFTEAGVTVDVVDTPGIYELTARPADQPTDAYSLASFYAQMTLGYIYETTTGEVGFANESRRFLEVQANGYYLIPLSYILGASISSDTTLNNITNSILLSYKNNQTVTADDPASIANFGLQAATISTELEQMSQAQDQVDRYIGLRANPNTNLSTFTIPLDSSFMLPSDLDDFLAVYMGKPIEIVGLPNAILPNGYAGFIEGWQLSINEYQALLTVSTTEASLSIPPTRWQDAPALQQWEDVNPAVQWFAYE
jgi:hypothetical protein